MQVEFTSYGRTSLTALRRRIALVKAGNPMAPVTVIVPNNVAASSPDGTWRPDSVTDTRA